MNNGRTTLVAPCGIDCGVCELNMCKDNPPLREALIAKGIPREILPCSGCRMIQGACPVIPGTCETFKCVGEHHVEFCYECGQFPCVKLQPSADRANILPHNMKVFNLCTMRSIGVEQFVRLSPEIKQRYYAGTMEIGNGPQLK